MTTETKSHTPAPWIFKKNDSGTRSIETPNALGQNSWLSLFCDEQYYPWCSDNDADWCLIAAAPELLDVVKRLMTLYTTFDAERPFSAITAVFDDARAVIAKAEGR